MPSTYQSRTFLALLMAFFLTYLIAPQHVIAQVIDREDPREMIRHYPAIQNIIGSTTIELGKRMLEWQIQRGAMTQRHMEDEIENLRSEIRQKDEAVRDVVTENTPAQFRFATDEVREQLIGQVLQKLLNAELEIAAHEALIEILEDQPRSERNREQTRFKLRDEVFETRENALSHQLAVVKQSRKNVEAMAAAGTISQQIVDEVRLSVMKLEGELAELRLERELNKHEHEHSADLAQRLADVRLEAHRLKALKQAAERQLEELTKAAELARKWQSLQREIDQLNERLLVRVKRLEEVEMETEEAQLLLRQVQHAMKEQAKPADTDD